jgi:hypothetical protein
MERIEMSKKGLYMGTGVGLILFFLVGMLSGSLVGGLAGLKIAQFVTGGPMAATLFARVTIVVSMLVGVAASAVLFIGGMGALGWAAGFALESFKKPKLAAAPETAR